MPLDPSIYQNVGRVNVGASLSSLLDEQRARDAQNEQRQMSLASLAMQQDAMKQQQTQKRNQELNMWLSGAVQSGRPQEEVMAEAIAKGQEIGVAPEITQRHVQNVYASSQAPQARSDFAFAQAYPDLVAKQRAEAMFPKKTGVGDQRGVVIYDEQGGGTFVVNPYTSEATPVNYGGKQIKGAQYSPELQSRIAGSKSTATEIGKAKGEATASLQDIESQLPHLEKLVTDLSDLGKKATYTQAGQVLDVARRQLGMNPREAAIARKEYISKVDNEILPLLRQTFGAAFTQKEGESLRITLGDPNATPEEKDAVLRSFIETKKSQVESLRRRTESPASGMSNDILDLLNKYK